MGELKASNGESVLPVACCSLGTESPRREEADTSQRRDPASCLSTLEKVGEDTHPCVYLDIVGAPDSKPYAS